MTDEENKRLGEQPFIVGTEGASRAKKEGKEKRVKYTNASFKELKENIRKGVIDKKIEKYNREYHELRRLAKAYQGKVEKEDYKFDDVITSARRYSEQMKKLANLGARILVWDDEISKIRVEGSRPIKVPGWAIGPIGNIWAWYKEKKMSSDVEKIDDEIKTFFEENNGVQLPHDDVKPTQVSLDKLGNLQFYAMAGEVKKSLVGEESKKQPVTPNESEEKNENKGSGAFAKRNLKDDFISNKLLSEKRYSEAYSTIDDNYLTVRVEKVIKGKKCYATALERRIQNTGDDAKDYEKITIEEFAKECGIKEKEEARKAYNAAIKAVKDSKTIINTYKDVWSKKSMSGDSLSGEGRAIFDGYVNQILTNNSEYSDFYKREELNYTKENLDKVMTVVTPLLALTPFRKSILEFGVVDEDKKTVEVHEVPENQEDIERDNAENTEVNNMNNNRTPEEIEEIMKGVKAGYGAVAASAGLASEEQPLSETPGTKEEEAGAVQVEEKGHRFTFDDDPSVQKTHVSETPGTKEEEAGAVQGEEKGHRFTFVDDDPSVQKTHVDKIVEEKPNEEVKSRSIEDLSREFGHYITLRDNLYKAGESPEVEESLRNVQKLINLLAVEIGAVARESIVELGNGKYVEPAPVNDLWENPMGETIESIPVEGFVASDVPKKHLQEEVTQPPAEPILEAKPMDETGEIKSAPVEEGIVDESKPKHSLKKEGVGTEGVIDKSNVFGYADVSAWEEILANPDVTTYDANGEIVSVNPQLSRDSKFEVRHARNALINKQKKQAQEELTENDTERAHKDLVEYFTGLNSKNEFDEAKVRAESENIVSEMEATEGSTPVEFIQTMKQNNPQVYESIQAAHRRRLERQFQDFQVELDERGYTRPDDSKDAMKKQHFNPDEWRWDADAGKAVRVNPEQQGEATVEAIPDEMTSGKVR